MSEPLRGEIWLVDLDPTRGREQAGKRPALVVSANAFNKGPADLVVVLPITSKAKGIPLHVRVDPPEGGVKDAQLHQVRRRPFRGERTLGPTLGCGVTSDDASGRGPNPNLVRSVTELKP